MSALESVCGRGVAHEHETGTRAHGASQCEASLKLQRDFLDFLEEGGGVTLSPTHFVIHLTHTLGRLISSDLRHPQMAR